MKNTFKVEDSFTGITHEFTVSNVRIEDIEGDNALLFTVETSSGAMELCEWVSLDDGEYIAERTDSHIKTNQIDELYNLFPALHEMPQPMDDLTPVSIVLEAAEEIINNAKK